MGNGSTLIMCHSSSEVEAIKEENGLLKFEAEAVRRLSRHDKLIREAEFYRGLLASILKWLTGYVKSSSFPIT